MQWFFFACTVNVAVGYATVLPRYYRASNARMAQLTPDGSENPFPMEMWSKLAWALAITFTLMAVAWCFLGKKLYVIAS